MMNNELWSGGQYMTEPETQIKTQTIFKIEEANLPTQFDGMFTPLPNRVEFRKIVTNVLNSLKFLSKISEPKKESKKEMQESTFDRWQKYLQIQENFAVVSDSFWYIVSKHFKRADAPKHTDMSIFDGIEEQLLKRISKNYINLFLSIVNKKDNHLFFKTYFDVLAQSVFYSLFYSFPLSRTKFNDDLKKILLDEFSYLFTGICISNSQMYIKDWNLDLGAGNIFKMELESKLQKQKELESYFPPIELQETQKMARNKRSMVPIKFSPIVEIYLRNNKYATRNYIQGFKMKFTEMEKNEEEVELKFARYLKLADQIKAESDKMKKDNEQRVQKMKFQIKEIKQETVNHHKRLEKRKAEELERGAHEYANYLVSMLNAGITVANLGVSKQK